MLGTKERSFTPIDTITLEDLVPVDHFYRVLERALDIGFVRDLVADRYAPTGRPSIDPVVFFKLQLVMFLEGSRSERQLLVLAADRFGPGGTPSVVSGLRPQRSAARSFQPDAYPRPLRC
jgi:hypothetical protein